VAEDQDAQYERLGGRGRTLTIVDAIAQSVGFMGPVFSIAFLVPLLVGIISATGKGGGNAAPLSVLIAALGVLALGWIVAQYTRKIQAAGSLYDYVTDGLGSRLGAASGLLYYVGIMVLATGLLVLAAVLYLGVALSTRAQLALALISITVVLIFFIYVIIKVGGDNNLATAFKPSSSPQGWNGVFFGVLYGVLLFTGFETSANLAEETSHPKRDIPKAVLISVIAVAGFYVIGSYATVAGYHFSLDALGENAGAPLFGLAGPSADGGFGSVALRRIIELVVIFDMLAVLIGCSVAASRGFFAMARDHRLPKPLARVSSRGTPSAASTFVLAFGLLVIIVTKWWTGLFALPETPHYASMFYWGSTFGGFALATIYFLMSVGALRGLRDASRQGLNYTAAVVGIVITLAAVFGSVYKVTEPTIYAPYTALAIFVIGLLLTWVMPGRPSASTRFAELAESEQGPVKL
jgi:amino acid transporter